MSILIIILSIISALLIVVSILMSPDSTNISGALVGSSDIDLFIEKKSRGAKKWFITTMYICGILLMVLVIVLKFLLK